MAALSFCTFLSLMVVFLQGSTGLPVLTAENPTYWLPLKPDGSDGRHTSMKDQTVGLASSSLWECIFDPRFRDSSQAFEEHWRLAQPPNISDPTSPYYDALDKTSFSTYIGDENQLSTNSSNPEAATKWLTFERCFNVNSSTCGKCQLAIESAVLFRRSFLFRTRPSGAISRDAVVMGTGPAGLLAAIELSLLGHRVIAAEERYSPDGYTRVRSLGNFRTSERLWSAIGMPRQFTSNAFYYKSKRGSWLFMFQEYMKMVAIKAKVVFASDCAADFEGETLILQSRKGKARCSLLNASTAEYPEGERTMDSLAINSANVFVVNAMGANKPETSRWALGTKIIAGAPQEMTEVLAELLRQNHSYEDYWAPHSYEDMQGASVVKLPNQWAETVNGGFYAAMQAGDLREAWERFKHDAINTTDALQTLGSSLMHVSDMDFPKNSYFYMIRRDVALFIAFIVNLPNRILRTNGSFDGYSNNSFKFPLPPSSSYGGTSFQVDALPNTALFPIPNNSYCKRDKLAHDEPEEADIDGSLWSTAPHFEGPLQPAPVGGDLAGMAKLAIDFFDKFDPGATLLPANSSNAEKVQYSIHKLKEIIFRLLRIAYPQVPEIAVRRAVDTYVETQTGAPGVAAMSSGVIRLGFASLPWQKTGPANQRVIATNENRTSFPVGDAAEPAWYRFGLGLDESWRTSRVAVLCSVATREACDKAILHQQFNWRQRVIHLFFDGWYTQFWKMLPRNSTQGITLNKLLRDLISTSKQSPLGVAAPQHDKMDDGSDEYWYVPWSQKVMTIAAGKRESTIFV